MEVNNHLPHQICKMLKLSINIIIIKLRDFSKKINNILKCDNYDITVYINQIYSGS